MAGLLIISDLSAPTATRYAVGAVVETLTSPLATMAPVVPAAIGAVATLGAIPYLAGLTRTVPDRADRRWWRPTPSSRSRRLATTAAAVPFGALAGAAAGPTLVLPALFVLALVLAPLVVIDIEVHRLPDRLVAVAALELASLLALTAALRDDWPAYLRALASAGLVGVLLFAVALAARGAFGLGDVKLAAVLAAALGWFGWPAVYTGLLCAFGLGAAVALTLMAGHRAGRRTALPFGPMLVLGTLLTLAFA
jgi:leader peptidase (prepilin peptidase)/N-methyltransferase